MKFELLPFRITVKLALKGPVAPQERRANTNGWQKMRIWLWFLYWLALFSDECVRSSPTGLCVTANWSKLDPNHCPSNWSWLVAELHGEAASVGSSGLHERLCTIFEQGSFSEGEDTLGSKVKQCIFLISSFECEWLKLVWPNWSSEAKNNFSYLTQRLTHWYCPLTLDPRLWIWSAGCESTFFVRHLFKKHFCFDQNTESLYYRCRERVFNFWAY